MSYKASTKGTNPVTVTAALSLTGSGGSDTSDSTVENSDGDQFAEVELAPVWSTAPDIGDKIHMYFRRKIDGTNNEEAPGTYVASFEVVLAQTAKQYLHLHHVMLPPEDFDVYLTNDAAETISSGTLKFYFWAGVE